MRTLIEAAARLGIRLAPQQVQQFQTYYELLVDWNRRINLTAVTDYEEVQSRHFLDSLTVLLAVPLSEDGRGASIIDVGTGAGLPGVPLKIVLPRARLVLLESVGKKTAFLQELVARLGLSDVAVVNARAEEAAHLPEYREQFSFVLARALAKMATLAELTLPFCRIGGAVVAQKKGDVGEEIEEAARAIALCGGRLREVKIVEAEELPPGHCLVVIEKTGLTPEKYPRRAGMPAKKPILAEAPRTNPQAPNKSQ